MATVEKSKTEVNIYEELIGGLSLLPYAVLALLSSAGLAAGWLQWGANGGPPFLGFVVAFLIDRVIRQAYKNRYGYSFQAFSNILSGSEARQGIFLVGMLLVDLLLAWYADAHLALPVRLLPLLFGVLVAWRGIGLLTKGLKEYGMIHLGAALLPLGASFIPLLLQLPTQNRYLGMDGIFELACYGLVLSALGVVEHLIIDGKI